MYACIVCMYACMHMYVWLYECMHANNASHSLEANVNKLAYSANNYYTKGWRLKLR